MRTCVNIKSDDSVGKSQHPGQQGIPSCHSEGMKLTPTFHQSSGQLSDNFVAPPKEGTFHCIIPA